MHHIDTNVIGTPAAWGENKLMPPIRGEFLIHVDIQTIMRNREKNQHEPVILVRKLDDIDNPIVVRELMWSGPSRFVHHDFMRIPGTQVQNWVETDGPLTALCDYDGVATLAPSHVGLVPKPMTQRIRGKFIIHVAAPVLMRNRQEGRDDPVIAVRLAFDWENSVMFCRKVEWTGPTRMVHRPTTPIPGTNGRGISFIETDSPLVIFNDDHAPTVLYDFPARRAA